MNKFEQVSSDDHQLSLAGSGVPRSEVQGRSPGLMSGGGAVSSGEGVSYHVTYPMMHLMLPLPHCGLADACENIPSRKRIYGR